MTTVSDVNSGNIKWYYLFLQPVVVLHYVRHDDVGSLHVERYFPRLLVLQTSQHDIIVTY